VPSIEAESAHNYPPNVTRSIILCSKEPKVGKVLPKWKQLLLDVKRPNNKVSFYDYYETFKKIVYQH